jgi:hypothetical protein
LQRIDLLWETVMLLLQLAQLGVERQHMSLDRTRGVVSFRVRKREAPVRGVIGAGGVHD